MYVAAGLQRNRIAPETSSGTAILPSLGSMASKATEFCLEYSKSGAVIAVATKEGQTTFTRMFSEEQSNAVGICQCSGQIRSDFLRWIIKRDKGTYRQLW